MKDGSRRLESLLKAADLLSQFLKIAQKFCLFDYQELNNMWLESVSCSEKILFSENMVNICLNEKFATFS